MKKLVLWDLDGTLLDTGGVASKAMRSAAARVFGPVPQKERTFFSGKTDWQIVHDLFPDLDQAFVAEQMHAFKAAYVDEIQQRRTELLGRSKVMPGVMKLLARLKEHAVQAPLTGNIAEVARIKLETLGLVAHLNIGIGAYGDDHHDRTRLVPVAVERASQRHGLSFAAHNVVIIGDTPNDIRCGKINDARTIAVATGPYSLEVLQEYEPYAAFATLRDVDAVLTAILAK
jgi:phosphoglycolate phosphatase-like HAD superfamily hydrolase